MSRRIGVLFILAVVTTAAIAYSSGGSVRMTANKTSLKARGKARMTLLFESRETDWTLACTGVTITGWDSPVAVSIIGRNPTGKYNEISGQGFKSGMEIRVDVARMPGTKKGDTGQCRLKTIASGDAEEGSLSFQFR